MDIRIVRSENNRFCATKNARFQDTDIWIGVDDGGAVLTPAGHKALLGTLRLGQITRCQFNDTQLPKGVVFILGFVLREYNEVISKL